MNQNSGTNTGFPWYLSDDLGKILFAEVECPGVWYISAEGRHVVAREYYLVERQTEAISDAAKAYGEPLQKHPEVLSYDFEVLTSGAFVVRYEIARYRKRNHMPVLNDHTMLSESVFGREYYPEYFGRYAVPLITPRGFTTRYRELMHGVFFVETDTCDIMLAVCYPLWKTELTDFTLRYSEQTELDRERGIDNTLGYSFFPYESACLAALELIDIHPNLRKSDLVSVRELMTTIWMHHQDYLEMWKQQDPSFHPVLIEAFYQFLEQNQKDSQSSFDLNEGTDWLHF